jgi:hypothetical protein
MSVIGLYIGAFLWLFKIKNRLKGAKAHTLLERIVESFTTWKKSRVFEFGMINRIKIIIALSAAFTAVPHWITLLWFIMNFSRNYIDDQISWYIVDKKLNPRYLRAVKLSNSIFFTGLALPLMYCIKSLSDIWFASYAGPKVLLEIIFVGTLGGLYAFAQRMLRDYPIKTAIKQAIGNAYVSTGIATLVFTLGSFATGAKLTGPFARFIYLLIRKGVLESIAGYNDIGKQVATLRDNREYQGKERSGSMIEDSNDDTQGIQRSSSSGNAYSPQVFKNSWFNSKRRKQSGNADAAYLIYGLISAGAIAVLTIGYVVIAGFFKKRRIARSRKERRAGRELKDRLGRRKRPKLKPPTAKPKQETLPAPDIPLIERVKPLIEARNRRMQEDEEERSKLNTQAVEESKPLEDAKYVKRFAITGTDIVVTFDLSSGRVVASHKTAFGSRGLTPEETKHYAPVVKNMMSRLAAQDNNAGHNAAQVEHDGIKSSSSGTVDDIYKWYCTNSLDEHAEELHMLGTSPMEVKDRLKKTLREHFNSFLNSIPDESIRFIAAGGTFAAFEIQGTGIVIKIPMFGEEYLEYHQRSLRELKQKAGNDLVPVEHFDDVRIGLSKFNELARRIISSRIGDDVLYLDWTKDFNPVIDENGAISAKWLLTQKLADRLANNDNFMYDPDYYKGVLYDTYQREGKEGVKKLIDELFSVVMRMFSGGVSPKEVKFSSFGLSDGKIKLLDIDTNTTRPLIAGPFSTGVLSRIDPSDELSDYYLQRFKEYVDVEEDAPISFEDIDLQVNGTTTKQAQKQTISELISEKRDRQYRSIYEDLLCSIQSGTEPVQAFKGILSGFGILLEAEEANILPLLFIAEALSVIPEHMLRQISSNGFDIIKISYDYKEAVSYSGNSLDINPYLFSNQGHDDSLLQLFGCVGAVYISSVDDEEMRDLAYHFKNITMRGEVIKEQSRQKGYYFIEALEGETPQTYLARLFSCYIVMPDELREVIMGDVAYYSPYNTIRPSLMRYYAFLKRSFEDKEYDSYDLARSRQLLSAYVSLNKIDALLSDSLVVACQLKGRSISTKQAAFKIAVISKALDVQVDFIERTGVFEHILNRQLWNIAGIIWTSKIYQPDEMLKDIEQLKTRLDDIGSLIASAEGISSTQPSRFLLGSLEEVLRLSSADNKKQAQGPGAVIGNAYQNVQRLTKESPFHPSRSFEAAA